MSEISVIPKEMFQPLADVAITLIDKLSCVAGFIVTPKGKRKDREDAVAFLVDEIKSNSTMPPMAKAAAISEARRMLKKYSNQNDIINMAMEQLSEDAHPETVDNDWIEEFLDRTENVSKEDLKYIFAKILAEECEHNGSISKRLLSILAIMNSNYANYFKKICKYLIVSKDTQGNVELLLIVGNINDLSKAPVHLAYNEIEELSNIGLLNIVQNGEYISDPPIDEFTYGDFRYKINKIPQEGCFIGQLSLTDIGRELANILVRECEAGYELKLETYFKSRGYEIERI